MADPNQTSPDPSNPTVAAGGTSQPKQSRPDDSQLAIRWKLQHRDTAWGMGDWRRYKNGVWNLLDRDIVCYEITTILENARTEGIRTTAGLLSSVMELARVKVSVPATMWDANPDYLPCKNGVLHIPTKTLLPHTQDIYATTQLPYDFDPTATCPNFMLVLQPIISMVDFFQEFAGYSLTPEVKHETAIWLQGVPGSGKSTVLSGLQTMLGTRAGLLSLRDIEQSRFALAALPGKTLVVSTESPDSYIAASDKINAIISGELIRIEQKYRDAMEIVPRAKICWAMNDLPRISGANNGLYRRIKIVSFPTLPEDQKDPELKDKIALEGAGILNWALTGLDRLLNRGKFDIPIAVQGATKNFQEHNDIPKTFLEEINATINPLDPQCRTQSQYLYDQYNEWCKRNNHKPLSSTRIADEWRRLGFEKVKIHGVQYWTGVEISPFVSASNIP